MRTQRRRKGERGVVKCARTYTTCSEFRYPETQALVLSYLYFASVVYAMLPNVVV